MSPAEIRVGFVGAGAVVRDRHIPGLRAVSKVFTEERTRPDGSGTARVLVPDAVFVCAEMECGALATMEWSSVAPFTEGDVLEVHGSTGTLRYLIGRDEILGGKVGDKQLQLVPIPPDRVRHWTMEEDFIGAIRYGKPVSPTFYDGLKYIEFTEAVIRSGEEKRSISLPLPNPEETRLATRT